MWAVELGGANPEKGSDEGAVRPDTWGRTSSGYRTAPSQQAYWIRCPDLIPNLARH